MVLRNLQKSICVRAPSLKSCRPVACNFIEKRFPRRCFSVSFAKFTRTAFLQATFFVSGSFFTNIPDSWALGEGRGYFFNSSLPPPSASQTVRHQLGDYDRELTSAYSQESGSDRKPLTFRNKSLTTKLRVLEPPGDHTGHLLQTASEKSLIKRKT